MSEIVHDQAQALRELVAQTAGAAQEQITEALPNPQSARVCPKLIAVASGKGGVGKSSITVNLAIALQQIGKKVLVVDADFGLANIDVMLGTVSQYNLSHLLKGEKLLSQIINEGIYGVKFISGGSGVYELLQMKEDQLGAIIGNLSGLDEAIDMVIFDAGAGINDNVLGLAAASSEVLVVTTPEPTAILDAYALVKTICKRAKEPTALPVFRLIMNKGENKKEAENAMQSFDKITEKYLNQRVDLLGSILFNGEVSRSIKSQTPLIIQNPQSTTAKEIYAIAATIANRPNEASFEANPLQRLFSRWFK